MGSLTDVDGIHVGHSQRTGRGWLTGTTAIMIPGGAVAAVDVRGGGPGTRETDALDPRNLVDQIYGLCLTGGSAYGLAAADGVMEVLEQRQLGVPVGDEPHMVVPVVPAAVIFDLGRGGSFTNRPDRSFGARAARGARRRTDRRGAIGAGTGAQARGLQGGVGMASQLVDLDGRAITVAALAVVNSSGSVIDEQTGLPWWPMRDLRRPTADDRRTLISVTGHDQQRLNTTIGVIATDAAITRAEAARLAMSAHDGLARAIRPAHGLMDGDTIFTLSTRAQSLDEDGDGVASDDAKPSGLAATAAPRAISLNQLCALSADLFAEACTDAVVSANSVGGAPAYRDLCPSAFRSVTSPSTESRRPKP